ncbi:hypothetical protein BC936DRAFT_148776 [Jimgerdemannia flammicorona]|uniref:Uncharacterized protein n=1 Tax=Jimgerdemannia flammicorona TaxID=994334 RepID=A0A433D2A9_9FUNG|nr:hypothetical protein BC936DRAFT_148776 [Jimgerdemannia flammicorona]
MSVTLKETDKEPKKGDDHTESNAESDAENEGIENESDDSTVSDSLSEAARKENCWMTEETSLDLISIMMESFTEAFKDIEDVSKWCLSTGKVVEDVLYEFGHLCHSYVLDPDDVSYEKEGIFTKGDSVLVWKPGLVIHPQQNGGQMLRVARSGITLKAGVYLIVELTLKRRYRLDSWLTEATDAPRDS